MSTELQPVSLKSRWFEILGNNQADMSDDMRRQRWEEWKRLGKEADSDGVEFWSTPEGSCLTCRHRNKDWCNHSQLPCTVNPLLTFSYNMIGMACQGAGYEGQQQELFD